MAALTNNYNHCQLLNLGYGPKGRGPFIVRQQGTAPGSATFNEEAFLLRKDGTWVINLAVFALPEKDKEQFIYQASAEAIQLMSELAGDPVVEAGLPKGTSVEQLKAAAQNTMTGLWGKIRQAKA
jgi:hypothetical protein